MSKPWWAFIEGSAAVSSLRTAVDAAAEVQAAKRARSLRSPAGSLSRSLSAMDLEADGAPLSGCNLHCIFTAWESGGTCIKSQSESVHRRAFAVVMHLLVSGGFSILDLAAGWLVTEQACDSASWHGAVCHVHVCVQLLPSQLLSLTTFSAPGASPAGRRQGSLDRASPLQQRHYYEEADPDRALAMLVRTLQVCQECVFQFI